MLLVVKDQEKRLNEEKNNPKEIFTAYKEIEDNSVSKCYARFGIFRLKIKDAFTFIWSSLFLWNPDLFLLTYDFFILRISYDLGCIVI